MKDIDIEFDNIIKQHHLSAYEKIQKMRSLKNEYMSYINKRIKDFQENYAFCPHCKTYYKSKQWSMTPLEETHFKCLNPLNGYLEKYEYEEIKETVLYYECPVGHLVLDKDRKE